jgi:D-3-phosphoglycerate dehydrogenase
MRPKVLITDAVHEDMLALFSDAGIEIVYTPDTDQVSVEKIIEDFEMLVINSKIQVNKNFIDKATKLKVVGRLGSGKEIINLEYAIHRDIVFHNSPEGNRDAVAEHCLGLILGLLNFIPRSFEEIKKHQWNREINRGNELSSKTVGIIGYGHTGKETAKRLSVFTSKILVYEKYEKGFSNDVVQEVEMEEIYTHADIISLHLPLTNETSQLINDDFINKMAKPFYLINTSRGKIVNESHVLVAMKNKKIVGYATDVLENEKLNTYSDIEKQKLKELISENTIITPHIAGWSYESKRKLAQILAKKMLLSLKTH